MTIFQPQISFSESHSRKWDRFIESYSTKSEFDSLSHSQKKRGSILWIILNKKVQFFESYSFWKKGQFFESYSEKVFNSLTHIKKKTHTQFFESYWRKKKIQFFESYSKKKFNSLSHTQKEVQFFESYSIKKVQVKFKKSSTLWVMKKHNSLSQTEEEFNSLSHIGKPERFNSSRHIEKRLQLFHIEKRFIKRGSILWVLFQEFYSLSLFFFWHTVQFFESCKKGSILWVTSEKEGSILWVIICQKTILCVIM